MFIERCLVFFLFCDILAFSLGRTKPLLSSVPSVFRPSPDTYSRWPSSSPPDVTEFCAWDERMYECTISDAYRLYLVEKSQSPLARVYEPFLKLNYDPLRPQRNFRPTETTAKVQREDLILSHLDDYASSPCYADVSTLYRSTRTSDFCLSLTTEEQCRDVTSCTWASKDEQCLLDSWYLLYGVKSKSNIPENLDAVLEAYDEMYVTEFELEFGERIGDPQFRWSAVLNWNLDTYPCPAQAPQSVCDYAQAFARQFPVSTYCAGQYPGIHNVHRCELDPLCEPGMTADPSCRPSSLSHRKAQENARAIFLEGIGNPLLHDVYSVSSECSRQTNFTCALPNCLWSARDGKCLMSQKWIASKLFNFDPDPLCRLFSIPAMTTCYDATEPFLCGMKELCAWATDKDTCEPTVDVFLSAIGEEDLALAQELQLAKQTCAALDRSHCSYVDWGSIVKQSSVL